MHFLFAFLRPMDKMVCNEIKWGQEVLFPTNPDLVDILGRTDFDFENFYFWDLFGSKFPWLTPHAADPSLNHLKFLGSIRESHRVLYWSFLISIQLWCWCTGMTKWPHTIQCPGLRSHNVSLASSLLLQAVALVGTAGWGEGSRQASVGGRVCVGHVVCVAEVSVLLKTSSLHSSSIL